MVKLENIVQKDGYVYADYIPEGLRETKKQMVMSAKTYKLVNTETNTYTTHARYRMREYLKKGKPLPNSITVIWY